MCQIKQNFRFIETEPNKDVILNRKQVQQIRQELLQKKIKYMKVIYNIIQENKVKLMSAPKLQLYTQKNSYDNQIT